MKIIDNKQTLIHFILALALMISLIVNMIPVQSVIIDTGVDIEIENETYRVDAAMNFSRVVITDTYPIFNNTGFNVTAPDDILFVLYYINQSTTSASIGDKLVEVSIYLLGVASTTVIISGFVGNTLYEVLDNSISQGNFLSDIDGDISLTVDVGPSTLFEIQQTSTVNTAPVISSPFPVDSATDISIAGSPVNAYIIDADGNTMNTSMWSNHTGTWTQYAGRDLLSITGDNSNASILDRFNDGLFDLADYTSYIDDGWQSDGWRGFYENIAPYNMSVTDNWGMTDYGTKYYWSVNCTDGSLWTNETYSFTTVSNTAPTLTNPSPSDGASGVGISTATISIDIADTEGTFNWSITTSPDVGSSSANGASDGSKTCSVAGLTYDATYLWTVSVTDGSLWTNTTYSFSVESDPGGGPGPPANSAPVITLYYPEDESTLNVLQPECRVLVTDADLETVDVSFYNSTDGVTWTYQQSNSSAQPGSTIYWNYSQASEYNTLYYWRVYANDGTINISRIFSFTTYPNEPVMTTHSPSDGATDVSIAGITITAEIFDYQGDNMNISILSNYTGSWVEYAGRTVYMSGTSENYEAFILDNDSSGDWNFQDIGLWNINNGWMGNGSWGFYQSIAVTDDWGMTNHNTKYYISINISDNSTERAWTNTSFSFTTEINTVPVIDDPIPRNGKPRISIYMDNVSVMITDANSDFNYTIETYPDIGNISENNVVDGVKTCTVSGMNYSTTYTWYVNVTDGIDWVNASYTFTTKSSTDFDLEGFKLNFPEWAMGPYKVYVGDFVWMFLFIGVIAITWGSSDHISSTLLVILLMFAAYGTQRVFVDNSEISLLFSIIAVASVAAIMLGLFLRKRNG